MKNKYLCYLQLKLTKSPRGYYRHLATQQAILNFTVIQNLLTKSSAEIFTFLRIRENSRSSNKMDTPSSSKDSDQITEREGSATVVVGEGSSTTQIETKPRQAADKHCKSKKSKKDKADKSCRSKSKKAKEVVETETETETEDDESSTSSSSSTDSDSETETEKEKEKKKKKRRKAKLRAKKLKEKRKAKSKKRAKKDDTSDSDSTTDSDSDDDDAETEEDSGDAEAENDADEEIEVTNAQLQAQLMQLQLQLQRTQIPVSHPPPQLPPSLWSLPPPPPPAGGSLHGSRRQALRRKLLLDEKKEGKKVKKDKGKRKRGSKLEYKRVDQLWDSTIHNYKLTDTAEDEESSEYDQYLFNVRRKFDWEGKYRATVVDIKSKLLKEALNEAMDGVKGVSLVEESPSIDPNLLFLYLEDLRKSCKQLKNKKATEKKGKKKIQKRNETKRKHLKVLLKYLDKDYASTKKTLYPMLETGIITFDLLWALYKPNTLAYTTTYGTIDEPRAFKIELAEKNSSFMRGTWYHIEGKYLEYDGKTWGMGTMDCEVPSFKGARKITSLNCYPLKYHRNEAKLRIELIERGKKFVALQGVHYKSHKGMAYYKKRKAVVKVNIDGRVMVDPAIHRRILPNYSVSTVKPNDPDLFGYSDSEDDDECGCCGDDSSEEGQPDRRLESQKDSDEPKMKLKIVMDEQQKPQVVQVPVDEDGNEVTIEKLEEVPSKITTKDNTTKESKEGREGKEGKESNDGKDDKDGVVPEDDKKALPVFTDEEYLIASPVVLGFAFAEKLWLEFTVSGIKDIVWNEGAYDSLVLEDNTKAIVKALVESHKYHPAESIDDVIQGKGKGLVAVLHGPPGTGKTLTAEGISELLKCPLYMVSAGELGTDPRTLEAELQKILDIAHAWGAVLLLDEADVFLEKRTIQDIHRNALVSIFLRLLEYFQGILFLTTNRVETFDDAFQSRIHIALRYGDLSTKAKKSVFKIRL
ncbi:hypothetical protein EYC80_001842 [Monilinia laxa]|uniref:AAA+ ATPase domain-containing protein n=1 Tax=Monilinia laxa TaxID=61186 RepID=A0A5N6K679_MONLA|nr:hypothetical protein EYC80_001842 [Monilinia laxa]